MECRGWREGEEKPMGRWDSGRVEGKEIKRAGRL